MAHKLRHATLLDLWRINAARGRQHVFHLNPPYTLVQPEALSHDLLKSQLPGNPRSSFVYVYSDRGTVLGYVQARQRWHREDEWTITTIAASDRAPDHIWEALLEEVCRAAGEQGVMRLFVKVADGEPLMEEFRALGFTRYTNERIWGNLYFGASGAPSTEPPHPGLRRQANHDAWDLMQLYNSVTPPVAKSAEDLTTRQWRRNGLPRFLRLSPGPEERAYVWGDESGSKGKGSVALGGYIRLLTAARGHWITTMFLPDAANRAIYPQALDYVLWKAARLGNKPVYSGVREYQVEAEGHLEERGFHLLSEQALLVKYLTEPIRVREPALVRLLAPKRGELVASK
jgi:N-acetylglutamate synthase-like GNAT family acetyltransferase